MLGGALPVQTLAWTVVELRGDCFQRIDGVDAQVAVFRQILPEQRVHVLVGSPLPWFTGVGEVGSIVEEGRDLVVAGHFRTLVPGQRAPQMLGQLRRRCRQCRVDLDRGVGGGKVQQHHLAALLVDEGADC